MGAYDNIELLGEIEALEWTLELRPGHPWFGRLILNKAQVIALLEGRTLAEAREEI
jgi:hypothetical protein